jgi:hypothetical protein
VRCVIFIKSSEGVEGTDDVVWGRREGARALS